MSRPIINGVAPFFIVRNAQDAVAFYRDKLGFDGLYQGPESYNFFGMVGRDRAMLMVCFTAAEVNVRTVRVYLQHCVPIEPQTTRDGQLCSRRQRAAVSRFFRSKGAKIDATNSYGDSQLDAAVQNQRSKAVAFLRAHGATQIHGTPEQPEAASEAIVRKEMDRSAPTER